MGALLYRSALSAERKRQAFFEGQTVSGPPTLGLKRHGHPERRAVPSIEDIDPRIGPRLEVFIAGEYVWLPFAHIGSLTMGPPRYLRDLALGLGHHHRRPGL